MDIFTISKKTFYTSLAILVLTGCLTGNSSAQIFFFNNGAEIYTDPAAILHVNGGFQNDNSMAAPNVFENNGTLTIATIGGIPGSVFLTNNSTLQGNGTYLVEQDWTNDAVFSAGSSIVNLDGNTQQFITSTNGTITTFNNLILTGAGIGTNRKKTLQSVSAKIGSGGTLTINDRELETLTNTMYVLNPSSASVGNNAISNPPGFVSSSFNSGGSGSLSRVTNLTSAYVFPTGSSAGTIRYRPLILKPAAVTSNTYTARLGNNDASIDGFNTAFLDTNTCTVNPLFYHEITHPAGGDNASIDIFYDLTSDGGWDGIAKWNSITPNIWNNMGTVATASAVPFNDVLKANWADFSNSPYILSRQKPSKPVITYPSVCSNSSGNIFSASGNAAAYTWSSPAGSAITSGQNTNTVTIDWGITPGPVTVTASSTLGCISSPSSCLVNSSFPPATAFSSNSSEQLAYQFTDLSTGSATQWAWDFGDGTVSNLQNPSHAYTSCGSKKICLTAGKNGCSDTACSIIDLNSIFNIPNVFTPDGDGINDVFFINNTACIKDFHLEIFNRWGMTIFESVQSGNGWDGYTPSGVASPDGTYYYLLKTTSLAGKDESIKGFISLVRKK